ncbi:MAG TPA: hypothetical protein PKA60_01010 [Candidatus Paceibacterota bacterium]|nr:hypothetical protein [Candidatus Paceibacterota bacterium]
MENDENLELKNGEDQIDALLEIGLAEDLIEEADDVVEDEHHIDPLVVKAVDAEEEKISLEDEEEDEEEEEYDLAIESFEDVDNF